MFSAGGDRLGHDERMSTFDERAQDWDTPERRERAEAAAQVIRGRIPMTRSMRAIDLGAGTGLLGIALAPNLGEVVLAEPSAGMLEVARQKLSADGPDNVSAIEFDLPGQPPEAAPFDLAVSLLVLHHVADTEAVLRSIRSLLVRGGYMALLDLDKEDGSFHDPDAPGIHHEGFDQAALCRLAESAGFTDVSSTFALEIEKDGRPYPLFLLTARAGPAA